MSVTCPLCWTKFPTVEELVQHEELEELVPWSLTNDQDPSQAALNG